MVTSYKKLHLGCGNNRLPGWVNIDLDSSDADIHLDLTEPLPFDDCSVSHIFAEHFIEHITLLEAFSLIGECRRVLVPDGVIRISTPSLRFLIESYLVANKNEWGALWQPETSCLLINEGMRSWGHQFIYDADQLQLVLIDKGFNSISFQEYRKSQDTELCGLESRPFHNDLIIEARKTENSTTFIDRQLLEYYEKTWPTKLNIELGRRYKLAVQTIDNQTKYFKTIDTKIAELQQTISNQTTHIKDIEADWSARGRFIAELQQTISNQTTHIKTIESELIKYQQAFFRRFFNALSKLFD